MAAPLATCLKSDGLNQVWLMQPPDQPPRIVKTWRIGILTWLKLAFGIAQPQRQAKGIRLLQQHNIRTPRLLQPWRIVRRDGQSVVQIELEYAAGISAFDLITAHVHSQQTQPQDLVRSARAVGAVIAQMISAGIFNRDVKPSNVIINLNDRENPVVWIIDTVGVRPMRSKLSETERMLERLAIQPSVLDTSLTRAMRIAAAKAALRPLTGKERAEVFSMMRRRIAGAA